MRGLPPPIPAAGWPPKGSALRGGRRARKARPYAETESHRGGFQRRPRSLPPRRGEGVTAYAVTDEGSSSPHPSRRMAPKGFRPAGRPAGAQSAPLRRDRRHPVGAASSTAPEAFPPPGEGVTAYAVTDEGSSSHHPSRRIAPKGFRPAGRPAGAQSAPLRRDRRASRRGPGPAPEWRPGAEIPGNFLDGPEKRRYTVGK